MPAALTGKPNRAKRASDRLAIDGGSPRLAERQVAAWPALTPDEEIRVVQALRRRVVADRTPEMVTRVERSWAGLTGCTRVVACRSGSVAVRLAAASLGLEDGDEVIVPADATVTARLLCEATHAVPVFVDLDPQTLHIDPAAVEAAITPRSRAILAVDRFGTTANYTALRAIAEAHGLTILEDGSRSVGAQFNGSPVGDLGAGSVVSLPSAAGSPHAVGGLFATSNEQMAINARRVLLVDDDLGSEPLADDPDWLGWSYRMPEDAASAAHSHLLALDDETPVRASGGHRLRQRLEPMAGIRMPEKPRGASHVYTSFPILVLPDEVGLPESAASTLRDTLIDCMAAEGMWMEAVRGQDVPAGEFPTLEGMLTAGLVLGEYRSPLESDDVDAVDTVAECFEKVLIGNIQRVRQLTLERLTLVS